MAHDAEAERRTGDGGEYVGVDVGGTKLAAGIVRDGVLDRLIVEPSDTRSPGALVDQVVTRVDAIRTGSSRGVGVGVPGLVDFRAGSVRFSINTPLAGVPLRDILGERLGMPVQVDNDASCAALAEAHVNGRLAVRNLVMLTLGTGVGGGLVLDGRLYRGATGGAGEMGLELLAVDLRHGVPDPAPAFPQPGSVEALVAGTALDRMAMDAATSRPGSALGLRLQGRGAVTGRDVVEEALGGDTLARGLLREIGERLGLAVANAINLFDPEAVVIGGGVARAGDLLLAPARAVAGRLVVPGRRGTAEIRLAHRRAAGETGVIGAALMVAQELEPAS